MDKIIKLNSRQGGPFTTTQNLCDFDIPADGTYDLSASYINLFARVTDTAGATTIPYMAAAAQQVAQTTNLAVNWKHATPRSFHNVVMVKNTSLTSEKVGVIEDIRRVDILRQTLNNYTMSTDKKESLNFTNLSSGTDQTGNRSSIFNQLYRDGTNQSVNKAARIQLPLSQLLEMGNMTAYPAIALGKSRLHLEMQLDQFQVVDATDDDHSRKGCYQFADMANGTATAIAATFVSKQPYTRVEDSPLFVNQRVLVQYTLDTAVAASATNALVATSTPANSHILALVAPTSKPIAQQLVVTSAADESAHKLRITGYSLAGVVTTEDLTCANTGAATSTKSWFSITSIQALHDFTGAITIGWANTATSAYMVERLIQSISYDAASFKQSLLIAIPDVPGNKTYSAISVTPVKTQTPGNLSVDSAELVLRRLGQNVKPPTELNYTTYSTEQYTGNKETDFQRMFQLEPEAVNVFMTFPQHGLFSRNGDLKSYRLRLDGQDLIDRDVSVNEENHRDPLYYDRLSMTLLNAMLPLNCLAEENKPVQPRYNPDFDVRPNGNELLYESVVVIAPNTTVTINKWIQNRHIVLNIPVAETGDVTYTITGEDAPGQTRTEAFVFTAAGGEKQLTSQYRYHKVTSVTTTDTPTQPLRIFADRYKLLMISSPIPVTPTEKLLQVNFDLSATAANFSPQGLEHMVLFKQVMRQIKM